MPGDRRLGLVRQPELAQADPAIAPRQIVRRRDRQEAIRSVRIDVVARQVDGHAAADDATARTENGDGDTVGCAVAESSSFAALHLPPERLALCEREPRRLAELLLDEQREREVEVVAAEQQVLADRDALERQLACDSSMRMRIRLKSVVPPPTSQTRTRAVAEGARQLAPMCRRSTRRTRRAAPRAASGCVSPASRRRLDRQLARFFVERCRHGEHDRAAARAAASRPRVRASSRSRRRGGA